MNYFNYYNVDKHIYEILEVISECMDNAISPDPCIEELFYPDIFFNEKESII